MKKSNKKSQPNYFKLFILATLAISIFVVVSLSDFNPPARELKADYIGLAKLGVIPSTIQCSHDLSLYDSTNVGMQDKTGNKYLVLASKFGDETCLYKI